MAWYGVYRGVVLNNNDPERDGRVQVRVEGIEVGWALAARTGSPIQVGATVIVAFERGDQHYPIVLGRLT